MMEVLGFHVLSMVWAGHPVGFDLLTHGDQQFVAFYDADRHMTVGSRKLGEEIWTLVRLEGRWLEARNRLSTTVEWDSHNSITMVIDDAEQIHLCGNMHVDPLIYFRTSRPLDVTSFERVDHMVGKNEDRCTYPVFMRGPGGELVFRFRDGRSGNGVDYYNIYDVDTQMWRRLIDVPLLDGMDLMNAYARMPELGPDGWYHMVWMWRDTGDCATNHDLSYARSRDLVQWETGAGDFLELPITVESGAVIDPSPPGGGLINMVQSLGFDTQNRPVIGYQKYDENGITQAYNARLKDGVWKFYQTSDWDWRWDFGGGGSIAADVQVGHLKVEPDGGLSQSYFHLKKGSGIWKLDEVTLKPVGTYPPPASLPSELLEVRSDFPNMEVRTRMVRGANPDTGVRYLLRWETLPRNRDRAWENVPPPGELRLYTLKVK
ncbi:MAG: BNR repeat-containing protein [bacterium]|nr:BNR repeat-containing protein [bacterium]